MNCKRYLLLLRLNELPELDFCMCFGSDFQILASIVLRQPQNKLVRRETAGLLQPQYELVRQETASILPVQPLACWQAFSAWGGTGGGGLGSPVSRASTEANGEPARLGHPPNRLVRRETRGAAHLHPDWARWCRRVRSPLCWCWSPPRWCCWPLSRAWNSPSPPRGAGVLARFYSCGLSCL